MAQRKYNSTTENPIDSRYDDRFDPKRIQELEESYRMSPDASDMDDIEKYANDSNSRRDSDIDEIENYANDPRNSSRNIDDLRDREETANTSPWNNNVGAKQTDSSAQPSRRQTASQLFQKGKVLIKSRKGATGGIIGIILLVLGIGGGLLTPGMALVHLKETIENKIDSAASAVDVRAQKIIASRMTSKSVSGKCSGMVKIHCRFKTFSDTQLKELKAKGITMVDGDGNEIKAGEKPRGDTRMKLADGKEYKASQITKEIRTNATMRSTLREVYPTRFAVWNDKVAGKFMYAKKLVRNPKWTTANEGGDAAANKKQVVKNVQENALQGDTVEADLGDYSENVDEGKQTVAQNIEDGKPVGAGSSNAAEVLSAEAVEPKNGIFKTMLKGASSIANPADILVMGCQSSLYANAIVNLAKVALVTQQMRFAMQFLSTADKIKAGEATPNDVSSAMEILETQTKNGSDFGDSTGYHYVEYGKTTNEPVSATLAGSSALMFFTGMMVMINKVPGLLGTCKTVSSVAGQVVGAVAGTVFQLILTFGTFGTGEAAYAATSVGIKEGTKAAVDKITKEIKDSIVKKIEEKFSKEAVKQTLKDGGVQVAKMGATAGGFFLASYLVERYFTQFAVNALTGTTYSGDMNGVDAMDTITSGASAMNAGISQGRGMTTLTPDQAIAYLNFSEADTDRYIADMQAEANPFDITDSYSVASSVGYSLSSFISSINVVKRPSNILAVPSKVLSSLTNPRLFAPSAFAESTADDQKALMNECLDTDATQDGTVATDPFCNPIYGFDDMDALNNSEPDDVAQFMSDHGYIDDDGNPTGDFATYSQTCFAETTNKVISSVVDESSRLDKKCYDRGASGLDQQTYTNFHLYQIDKGIIDQMDEPYNPANPDVAATPTDPQGAAVTGDAVQLAQTLLDQIKSGKVKYWDKRAGSKSDPKSNLESIAAGQQANTTPGCATGANSGTTSIDPRILQFLVDMGNATKYQINALAGSCHMKNSKHYSGLAVDFECNAVPFSTSIADPIAAKYGVKRNKETCAKDSHWHYDVSD